MIENQEDVREMIIASRNEKTLDLYIDHTNFSLTHRPEVVVRNLVTNADENMPPPPPSQEQSMPPPPPRQEQSVPPPPDAEPCTSSSAVIEDIDTLQEMC
jgi:hypothetical protein